jgi:hypothetical protein
MYRQTDGRTDELIRVGLGNLREWDSLFAKRDCLTVI